MPDTETDRGRDREIQRQGTKTEMYREIYRQGRQRHTETRDRDKGIQRQETDTYKTYRDTDERERSIDRGRDKDQHIVLEIERERSRRESAREVSVSRMCSLLPRVMIVRKRCQFLY